MTGEEGVVEVLGAVKDILIVVMPVVMIVATYYINRKNVKALEVQGNKLNRQGAKLEEIAVVADATHKLANKDYGASLSLVASLSREKADRTRDPVHLAAAEIAETRLTEHMESQAVVDSGPEVPVRK